MQIPDNLKDLKCPLCGTRLKEKKLDYAINLAIKEGKETIGVPCIGCLTWLIINVQTGKIGRYDKGGQIEDLLKELDQAIQRNPRNAEAYAERGNLYGTMNRDEEALRDFEQAIRFGTTDSSPYYHRGLHHLKSQRYKDAVRDFDQAIRYEPQLYQAYHNLGNAHYHLENFDEALSNFAHTVQINREDTVTYFNIGTVLAEIGRLRESIPYLEKAEQLGYAKAAQVIAQIYEIVGLSPSQLDLDNPIEAFMRAYTVEDMRRACSEQSSMMTDLFIRQIENLIQKDLTPALHPLYKERLVWLRKIANEK